MNVKPALIIIDAIGAERLESLGFNERLIRHVRSSGKFAAGWYRAILAECDAINVQCPLEAFNWKSAPPAPSPPTLNPQSSPMTHITSTELNDAGYEAGAAAQQPAASGTAAAS